jgi:glycosyltransferase involved in cell wall biosynthesis
MQVRIGFATTDFSFGRRGPDGGPAFGGAGYYRCFLPAEACARAGHEVVWGGLISSNTTGQLGVQVLEKLSWIGPEHPAFPKTYTRPEAPLWEGRHEFDLDVIVMQRWMLQDTWQYVMRARGEGQVVVNDLDDWFWGLDERNVAWAASHPRLNPTSNRDHYLLTCLASDVITVSTPYLADQLHGLLKDLQAGRPPEIVVLRNMIDLERWRPRPIENEDLTYGWVGAIPWRSGDVETLKPWLGKFLTAHPEVGFHHGGHMDGENLASFATLAGLPEDRVHKQWMQPTYERMKLYYPIDVGLVPLNDLPFNAAKSAIKGMEYLAAGSPYIAADTPEYRWAAEQGMGHLVRARVGKDWTAALGRMLDPGFREAERKRGMEALKAHDARALGIAWASTYETAVGSKLPA